MAWLQGLIEERLGLWVDVIQGLLAFGEDVGGRLLDFRTNTQCRRMGQIRYLKLLFKAARQTQVDDT